MLLGFVADEHVAHSGVNITAGTGLTGGGTIAASRTLSIADNGVTDQQLSTSSVRIKYAETIAAGGIGSYVFGFTRNLGIILGETVPGSGIEAAGLDFSSTLSDDNIQAAYATKGGATLSGSWMVMGRTYYDPTTTRSRLTLFLRTS